MDHNVIFPGYKQMVRVQLIVLFFFYVTQVFCGENDWIKETVDFTINNKFNDALELVTRKIQEDSTDYRAQFYLAATLNSKMTHFENTEDADKFNQAIDQTLVLVESEIDTGGDLAESEKAELLFYRGSAYGYRAFYLATNGNFISALANGIKSVGSLNQAIEIDSTLYGAYIGIGVYKYWRYSRLKFISWLPFIPDEREEGIAMINLAITSDSLSRYIAMHQLVYILLDYGRYEEAIIYADKIVERYPESQFMWWANAETYYKNKDYPKAKSSYRRLYDLLIGDKNRNISHLLKCKLMLALVYKELREFEKCSNQCESILEISQKMTLNDRMEDIVSRAIDLLENCKDLMNN